MQAFSIDFDFFLLYIVVGLILNSNFQINDEWVQLSWFKWFSFLDFWIFGWYCNPIPNPPVAIPSFSPAFIWKQTRFTDYNEPNQKLSWLECHCTLISLLINYRIAIEHITVPLIFLFLADYGTFDLITRTNGIEFLV